VLFDVTPSSSGSAQVAKADPAVAEQAADLRARMAAHPVHHDPGLADIEVWARRHDELQDKTDRLERTMRRRTRSLVTRFTAIVELLQELGYLDDQPAPTEQGLLLAGLYAETDLVLAECLRWGVFDGLTPPEMAALASLFTYESRSPEQQVVRIPTTRLERAVDQVDSHLGRIAAREEAAGLPPTRDLDAGLVEVMHRWAGGADLDRALGMTELTPGDFVRSTKMVADLVRQIRDATDDEAVRATAREANRLLVRGVVAH
jgi:ATP-dependent RNA helicase HelY